MNTMSCNLALIRWLRHIRCSDCGSAMVETVLIFPVFVAMLLGAVEFGDLAYKANEMTNGARAAAQYAAMNGGGYADCAGSIPGGTKTTCTGGVYAAAQLDAGLAAQSCSNFTVQEQTACACSGGSAGATCSSSSSAGYTCSSGRVLATVSIYTSAQCSPVSSVPNLYPISKAFTLTGFAQQEVLQ